MNDFFAWYLAPWRRMGRAEFSVFFLCASVPGFLLVVMGWTDGASGLLAPILDLMNLGNQAQGLDMTSNAGIEQSLMQMNALHDKMAQAMNGMAHAPAKAAGFDWSGFINNLLILLMIPLVRMRLRDMGKGGGVEWFWTAAVSLSALDGVLKAFGLAVFGGFSLLLALLSFVGFMWLCMAKSAPRVAPHEYIPPPGPHA